MSIKVSYFVSFVGTITYIIHATVKERVQTVSVNYRISADSRSNRTRKLLFHLARQIFHRCLNMLIVFLLLEARLSKYGGNSLSLYPSVKPLACPGRIELIRPVGNGVTRCRGLSFLMRIVSSLCNLGFRSPLSSRCQLIRLSAAGGQNRVNRRGRFNSGCRNFLAESY